MVTKAKPKAAKVIGNIIGAFVPTPAKAKTISKSAETGKIVSKKFADENPATTFKTKTIAKAAMRAALKFKIGVNYHFSNADTWFIGQFESFDPDFVIREDGSRVQGFEAINFKIREAAKDELVKAEPVLRPEVKPKYDPATRYFMTSKGGEDFIGTVVDGVVYRNELIGGVQVENALYEKPSEFKIRPATGPEIRPLKIMLP